MHNGAPPVVSDWLVSESKLGTAGKLPQQGDGDGICTNNKKRENPGHTSNFSVKLQIMWSGFSPFFNTGATTASIFPNIMLQDNGSVLATGRLYERAADECFVAQGGTENLFDCQFNYNCSSSNETATVTDVSPGCRLFPGEWNQSNPPLVWSFSAASPSEKSSAASSHFTSVTVIQWESADRRQDASPADEPTRER